MTLQGDVVFHSITHGTAALFFLAWFLPTVVTGWIAYQMAKAGYNISPFHPLSHIPGPRLAAATYALEFYYDVIKFGCYTTRIRQMHEDYGPIVRISPDEVHCNDARFIDEIYALGGRKRDKSRHQVRGVGTVAHAAFATTDHDQHRLRRSAIAKYFSRSQVSRLEPSMKEMAQRLCDKMLAGDERPFDITMAFSCFSTDVISKYCFGESLGFLKQKSWEPNFRKPLYSLLKPAFVFRFFPFLVYISIAAAGLSSFLPEDIALLMKTLTVDVPNQVQKARAEHKYGTLGKGPTVFGSLLESELPAEEKSDLRLTSEAISLLSAGTETVSWALTVITYHLLTKPAILDKLTDEVSIRATNNPEHAWSTLEQLPYLTAVILEGLRLSYGVASRTSRIATEEDLIYRGKQTPKGTNSSIQFEYVVPRGFAIGMSSAVTHHDEEIFPDSHSFVPERWLDEKGQRRKDLERSLLTFSKGSRACIGMNLAMCELYLVLAAMIVRVFPRMELYETTEDDIAYDHDLFNPLPKTGSKGVRAVITKVN